VAWTSATITALDQGHAFASDGFRLGAAPAPTVVELDRPVVVDRAAGTVDGVPVHQLSAADHVLDLVVDGHRVRAVVDVQPGRPGTHEVVLHGQRFAFTPPDRLAGSATLGDGAVTAPMPGTVVDVRVAVGDVVAAGDVLGVLEAMKMELSLKAPHDGTVTAVQVASGSPVAMAAPMFHVEQPED
jgi:3-methylcrotonyl-CoA carboxylase alpha subunit/acetyl-CoA/propionyl-CoA carboxylase biotin carboxyl carrier protein